MTESLRRSLRTIVVVHRVEIEALAHRHSWDPDLRCWLVPAYNHDELVALLHECGIPVRTPSTAVANDVFVALFEALPEQLRKPACRALLGGSPSRRRR